MLSRAAGSGPAPGDGDDPCCPRSSAALPRVGAQPWGAGGLEGSAPVGLCHPPGDPGKRGRGEREAKGLFIFKMFYNGIISSQEVFQIDLVRHRFHFSSAEMRWESSLWCEPLQSSGKHIDLKNSWHAGRTRSAPLGPTHPTHAFCSVSSVTPQCAASGQARLRPRGSSGSAGEGSAHLKGEKKKPSSKNPPFSPGRSLFFWGI